MWKVLIVEDSPTVRAGLVAAFKTDARFRIIGTADDPTRVARLCHVLRPDLVTLDLVMPEGDGISIINEVMAEIPTRFLVVSSRTPNKGTPMAIEALKAGAMDILAKTNLREPGNVDRLLKVSASLCEQEFFPRNPTPATPLRHQPTPELPEPGVLPPATAVMTRLIVIGASVGGPPALEIVLSAMRKESTPPVVIAQHMADGFGAGFAAWLDGLTSLDVRIASHGEALKGGTVYLAPDEHHIYVGPSAVGLERTHPEMLATPNVDRLLHSAAEHFGSSAIGVVMTGMGDDGARGLRALAETGAWTVAQDRATSFVFGMPQAAIARGGARIVLPLHEIAVYLSGKSAPSIRG